MRVMRAAVLAVLAIGCDSLAGRDYVGEPMFTMTGSFASSEVAPSDPVTGVALMWQDARGAGGPGVATTTVPVAIAFPATFRVDVPVPPPDGARFALGGVTLAEAYVYVVTAGGEPRGSDRTHALVFASAEVAAGTVAADYLGGAMPAGYHLRQFAIAPPGAAQNQLIESCVAGGATRDACQARRGYQLGPIGDDDPLRIVVTPP
jgi:hypothetical protein